MKNYKKKLAVVISSLEVGGAEKMVLDLLKEINEVIDVKLFIIKSNKNSIYDLEIKKIGIDVIYLNHKIKVFSLLVAMKLRNALSKYKPDIIHSHLKASTYVYFYNIFNKDFKWVHTVHTIAKIDTKALRRIFFKPLFNKQRVKLVAVSNSVKNTTKELYKFANIEIINNGINLEKFRYIKNTNGINLINVGRLELVKNHDFLLNEFNKLIHDIDINKLYLIGDGKMRDQIICLIKSLKIGSKVEMISHTNKVNEYLNMADIFVLTSHYEGMPLAVLEAMASGLIVIASHAASDVIKDNYNGFLINLKNDELYLKLKEVLTNLNKYEYIRINAIETAKEFSIEKMANEYLKIYLKD